VPADTTQPRRAAGLTARRGPGIATRAAPGSRRRDPAFPTHLTATVWPGGEEPLLVLDVSPSAVPGLRPGFVRDLTGDLLVIPHHPHAALLTRDDVGTVVLHSRAVATAPLPTWWRTVSSAILAVLPNPSHDHSLWIWQDFLGDNTGFPACGRGGRPSASPVDRFLRLLTDGVALVAEIDVRADGRQVHSSGR
jgi:hypothetical protein